MTKICNNPFRRFPGHRQLYRDIRSCFARIVLDLQLRPVLQLPLVCTIYACTGYANSPPESLWPWSQTNLPHEIDFSLRKHAHVDGHSPVVSIIKVTFYNVNLPLQLK